MTTNTTQTPEAYPARSGPEFDTAPGECLATGRAMWELGNWIFELRPLFFLFSSVACLFPGSMGGAIFLAGFLAAVAADLTFTELGKNRSAGVLRMLPLPSKQLTVLVWAMAALGLPLVYGCVQIPIRLIALFTDGGSLGWLMSIVPECVLASGLAATAILGRTMAPWTGPRDGAFSKFLYAMGQTLLGIAYFSGLGIGWILNRAEGIEHPAYIGAITAAVIIAGVSYRASRYALDSVGRTRQAGRKSGRRVNHRAKPLRLVDFIGIWIRPTLWVTGSLVFMCLVIAVMPYLIGDPFSWDLSSDFDILFAMPIILLIVYVRQQPRMEYRLIRSLPLRRSHQTLLILTFGLPFILPLSALVFGTSLFLDIPLPNTLAFLIAFGGCCEFALVLWPTIGIVGVFGAAFLCLPLVFAVTSWHSPWAICFYSAFAIVYWLGTYAFTYQQLCGDGAIYGERDVIENVVAGRN